MAKSDTTQAAAAAEDTPVSTSVSMTLDEFCIRLSTTDKRVELIGGFEHSERTAGRTKDTAENFTARYTAFINQPA